jgi:hypothetical protein
MTSSPPAFEQGLLDPGEAAAQQTHDDVLVDVGFGPLRAAAVELLQERDDAV